MPYVKPAIPRLLILSLAFVLAACGGEAEAPADASGTPATGTGTGTGIMLDEAIPQADISTRLALVSVPVHVVADDLLEFDVEVSNDGKAALTSEGKLPVQLGITLAGPDGVDTAPGVRDFSRVRLPLLPPGESRRVTVSVPVAPLEGLTVRLELVQELVAWFGHQYGQPTLDVGRFQRCEGSNALCDETGAPLATR